MNKNKGVKQKNNTQTIYFSDSFELSYVYGILYYPDAKNVVVVSDSSINNGSWSTRHWVTKEQFSACVCVSASVSFCLSVYCLLQIHATGVKHGKTCTKFMIGFISTCMA